MSEVPTFQGVHFISFLTGFALATSIILYLSNILSGNSSGFIRGVYLFSIHAVDDQPDSTYSGTWWAFSESSNWTFYDSCHMIRVHPESSTLRWIRWMLYVRIPVCSAILHTDLGSVGLQVQHPTSLKRRFENTEGKYRTFLDVFRIFSRITFHLLPSLFVSLPRKHPSIVLVLSIGCATLLRPCAGSNVRK